jgi:hypothetical protein
MNSEPRSVIMRFPVWVLADPYVHQDLTIFEQFQDIPEIKSAQ